MNNFSTKEIKRKSLVDLKGKWGICILEMILITLISFAVELPTIGIEFAIKSESLAAAATGSIFLSFATVLLTVFVLFPISVGNCRFFMNIAEGKEAKVSDIFFYKNMGQVVGTNILYGLIICAVVAVYCAFVFGGIALQAVSPAVGTILLIVGIIFYIIALFFVAFGYAMTIYVVADGTAEGVVEPLKASRLMMKGQKWNLFVLEISFIGWMILGILTAGLLYFWLVPYMETALANFYFTVKQS